MSIDITVRFIGSVVTIVDSDSVVCRDGLDINSIITKEEERRLVFSGTFKTIRPLQSNDGLLWQAYKLQIFKDAMTAIAAGLYERMGLNEEE